MSLEERILKELRRRNAVPLTFGELADQLEIPPDDRRRFENEVKALLRKGVLAKLKGNRVFIPQEADLVPGVIKFRQSGSALLIPEDDGSSKPIEPIAVRAEDTAVAFHNDRVLVRLVRDRKPRGQKGGRGKPPGKEDNPFGRVIRILERARTRVTGTLQKSKLYHYVVPDDPRIIQDILVADPVRSELDPRPEIGNKVVVALSEWKMRHLNPEGEIVEVLGDTHEPGAEFLAILRLYGLEPEFPEAVNKEVEKLPRKVRWKGNDGRLDLRDAGAFTIDPDDAKDFDDALTLERLEGGNTRVGIHIADVSAYVRPGSALDREAHQRGNSTYLVGSVIPMLPHALSNGICSLVENEERLTKSVFLEFSPRGRMVSFDFANSVIRSRKRLTYRQAYAFLREDDLRKIRGTPLPPTHQTGSTGRGLPELTKEEMLSLQEDIRALWAIAERLRRQRLRRGSLELDMPETKIFVDEAGYAQRIEKVINDESHQLIEEFMIAANEVVDREMSKAGYALLHRVHDEPDPDKLDEYREYLAAMGVEAGDLTHRKEVTAVLRTVKDHPQSHILKVGFLRSLKQACYRASPDGHYGLAMKHYAHFTSPIRRYADLVVHRIFNAFLHKRGDTHANSEEARPYATVGRLVPTAQHLSRTEQNSTEAERESVKVKLLEFFERELKKDDPEVFEAAIVDIRNHGMFVELTESMAYGLVHVSTLTDDFYTVSPDQTFIRGRKHKRKFALGEKIPVQVSRVDRFKRQIDFKVADLDPSRNRKRGSGRGGGGGGGGGGRRKPKASPSGENEGGSKRRRSRGGGSGRRQSSSRRKK